MHKPTGTRLNSSEKIIPFNRQSQNAHSLSSSQATRRTGPKFFSRRGIIVLAGVAIMVLTTVPVLNSMAQTVEFEKKVEQAKADNQVAIQQNQAVEAELRRMLDPNYLAEIARKDYYYSKPGEIIFDLGENDNQNTIFNQQD